jgi:uncharacterized protein with HEPN domain
MTTEARKRLHDVRLAAEALCRFAAGKSVEDFKRDEILQAAVERKLATIGEAFVRLREAEPALAELFTDLPQIVGMRNRLVHGYDQLDLDVLWDATMNHIPKLLEQVRAALASHPAG